MPEESLTSLFRSRPAAWVPERTIALVGDQLAATLRHTARRGVVVGISGGVDSATCAYLASRLAPGRLLLVHLPDRATEPRSTEFAAQVAAGIGLPILHRDLTAALDGLGVYRELEESVARILRRSESDVVSWKLVRSPARVGTPVRWRIVARLRQGQDCGSEHLSPKELTFIVSRMNHKQRMRAAMLYALAEEHSYIVFGTANRTELSTGFFVRHGDGAADMFPLAGLFKTEVRELASELGVGPSIAYRLSTSDTFSEPQTQEEFFFGMPEQDFDLTLFGFERGLAPRFVAAHVNQSETSIRAAYADLSRRQPYLRWLLHHADMGVSA